jgi:hypothetical protein
LIMIAGSVIAALVLVMFDELVDLFGTPANR